MKTLRFIENWLLKQWLNWKLVVLECDAYNYRVPVEQYIFEREDLLQRLENLDYAA